MMSALPLRWILLFLLPNLIHQASSELFSVKVQSPVSGPLGSSVSLHCALTNNMDVRHLEVYWYRAKMNNNPILLYKDTQIQKSFVDVQYQGRVFLVGELEKGDISLKLENLTLTDSGDYVCDVRSHTWYDKATVSLRVTAVGSTPVLTERVAGGEQVNVTCQSRGWLPEPSVTWTDREGRDLKHLSNDKFTNTPEGFVAVSSWLIVSPSESDWISCSVGLPDLERKESSITLHVPADVSESLIGYLIAIPIVLLLCAAGIAVCSVLHRKGLIHLKRKRTEKSGGTPSELEPLNNDPNLCVENQDVVVDIEANSEQRAKTPPTPAPDLNQQKLSEQKNLDTVNEKPQVAECSEEQRRSSSFSSPASSTTDSATDKRNYADSISDLKPVATMSKMKHFTMTSSPTDTTTKPNPPATTPLIPTAASIISETEPAAKSANLTPTTTVSKPQTVTTNSVPPSATTNSVLPSATTNSVPPSATTNSVPTPATTNPVPTPATTNPVPTPATTNPVPTPATTNPVPTPATTNPVPTPATTNPVPTPATTNPVPTTATTNPVPPSATTNPVPTTATTNPVPPSATTNSVPTPATTNPVPTTATTNPVPPSATTNSVPTTATTNPVPPSATTNSVPTPATTSESPPTTTVSKPTTVTTNSIPTPVTTNPVPTHATTNPVPTPATTNSVPTPATTTSSSTPTITKAVPIPATTTSSSTPAITKSVPTPATTNPVPTPSTTTSSSTPATINPVPTPATTNSVPTPATTNPVPTPSTTTSSSTPATINPVPTPATTNSVPTPATTTSSSTPTITKSVPTPATTTSSSTPATINPVPTLSTTTSSSTPATTNPVPTPSTTTSSSTPATINPVPRPSTTTSSSTPATINPVPTPATTKSVTRHSTTNPVPTPATTNSVPTPATPNSESATVPRTCAGHFSSVKKLRTNTTERTPTNTKGRKRKDRANDPEFSSDEAKKARNISTESSPERNAQPNHLCAQEAVDTEGESSLMPVDDSTSSIKEDVPMDPVEHDDPEEHRMQCE